MTEIQAQPENAALPEKPDWLLEREQQTEQARLLFERNKQALFAALKPTGLTHISVEFDGCGDSGQIEAVTALTESEDGSKPLPELRIMFEDPGTLPTDQGKEVALAEAIEDLCYGLLEQEHFHWEDNYGAFGTFRFDIAAGAIHFEFNERFEDCTTSSATF